MSSSPLFLGLDLSTQQLKLSLIANEASACSPSAHRTILCETAIHFDRDLPRFGTKDGSILRPGGVAVCPTACWVAAMDLCFERMKAAQGDAVIQRIRGIGGAAQVGPRERSQTEAWLTQYFISPATRLGLHDRRVPLGARKPRSIQLLVRAA